MHFNDAKNQKNQKLIPFLFSFFVSVSLKLPSIVSSSFIHCIGKGLARGNQEPIPRAVRSAGEIDFHTTFSIPTRYAVGSVGH